jgi:uncharacterized protein YydD (DUF2326 family)
LFDINCSCCPTNGHRSTVRQAVPGVAAVALDGRYPRFVFHDGIFESLDDRKKRNLLEVIRSYANLGVQHVVTMIDSDLPAAAEGEGSFLDHSEVVLRLHDEDDTGRLFRMSEW